MSVQNGNGRKSLVIRLQSWNMQKMYAKDVLSMFKEKVVTTIGRLSWDNIQWGKSKKHDRAYPLYID